MNFQSTCFDIPIYSSIILRAFSIASHHDFSTHDLFHVEGILFFSYSKSCFLIPNSSNDCSALVIWILFSSKIEKLDDNYWGYLYWSYFQDDLLQNVTSRLSIELDGSAFCINSYYELHLRKSSSERSVFHLFIGLSWFTCPSWYVSTILIGACFWRF